MNEFLIFHSFIRSQILPFKEVIKGQKIEKNGKKDCKTASKVEFVKEQCVACYNSELG